MFEARNKTDLIIEIWEKLDCESVGADEIMAIEKAMIGRFGRSALDSPMIIARLLADEGAILRHSEIMELYVEWAEDRPYDAAFRNILSVESFSEAASSLHRLENLRRKYLADNNKEGIRLVLEKGREGRALALEKEQNIKNSPTDAAMYAEIAEWITLWLQSPEMFENWVELRVNSPDFRRRFTDSAEDLK